jgi:hypothetical protein
MPTIESVLCSQSFPIRSFEQFRRNFRDAANAPLAWASWACAQTQIRLANF